MAAPIFPTSKDIYFMLDGKKVAVVQNYSTSYQRENSNVDSFGEENIVGYALGKKSFTINISKAYMNDAAIADGLDFYTLDNFDFYIVQPDRTVVYTGCSISSVEQEGQLNDIIAENINISATNRRED